MFQEDRVNNVVIEKQVNPPRDVDIYYEVNRTRVSLEVKSAIEKAATPDVLTLVMAGRNPNHLESFNTLNSQLKAVNPDVSLELGKNKDNTLKDFLVSAHSKFSPASNVDDLNILFVACDDYFNVQAWYFYLWLNEGLFTNRTFYPFSEYSLVDVVILSSLKYCHAHAQVTHDWTLNDVFLLPIVNPFRRKTSLPATILNGLGIFDHHLEEFLNYVPRDDDPGASRECAMLVKVNSYVVDGMARGERERYFPTMKFSSDSLSTSSSLPETSGSILPSVD